MVNTRDTLDALSLRCRSRRRVLDELSGVMRATLLRGKELQVELESLEGEISTLEKVVIFLNSLGESRQNEAQTTIEELVTRGLQMIFDDSLSFHIVPVVKASANGVEFYVRSSHDGHVLETPVLDSRGGGLAATVGFLLRVVVMLLSQRVSSSSLLLVLDETFAHVSDDYLESLGQFLQELVTRTDVQILMVTHQEALIPFGDQVYRFSSAGGRTRVTEIAHA